MIRLPLRASIPFLLTQAIAMELVAVFEQEPNKDLIFLACYYDVT